MSLEYLENFLDLAEDAALDLQRALTHLHQYEHDIDDFLKRALEAAKLAKDKPQNATKHVANCLEHLHNMKHLETVRAALAEDCKTLVTDRMAIIDGLQRDYHSGAYLAKEGLKNPPQSNKDAKRPSTASSSSRRKRAHRAEPQQTQDEDEEEAGTDTTSGGARQSKSRDNSKRGKSRQAARRAQENLSVDNDDIDAVIYQEEQTDTKKRGAQDAEEEEGDKYCIEGCTGTGEMVGCDNPDCPGQWFHYTCVGLTGPPDTKKWFCPTCKPMVAQSRRR